MAGMKEDMLKTGSQGKRVLNLGIFASRGYLLILLH